MNITQGQLATELGMSRRTLMRWLARLEIRPKNYNSGLAWYSPDVIDTIQKAHTAALASRADLVRASIVRRSRLHTLPEARSLAKGGKS